MALRLEVERALTLDVEGRSLRGLAAVVMAAWKNGVPDTARVDADWNHFEGNYRLTFKWTEEGK